MTHFTRTDWGARASKGPTPLHPDDVDGIAIHWPAMSKPVRGFEAVASALRGWQAYHMDTKGWSDIAYQAAVDQDGNEYDLRGLKVRSAANGDQDVNERYGALLLVLAPGEHPTDAMLATTRALIARHRKLYPRSKAIEGHQDIRPEPTACPGPILQGLIDHDAFEPTRPITRGPKMDAAIAASREMSAALREVIGDEARLAAAQEVRKLTRQGRRVLLGVDPL